MYLYPKGGTLIFSAYIGWADFLEVKFFNFNFFFVGGGGRLGKNDYFGGLEIFLDIFRTTSNFDNFLCYFFKIVFCDEI